MSDLLPEYLSYFGAYGIEIKEAVARTKDFMIRLLNSGVDPSSVSLEGFRYAYSLVKDDTTHREETTLRDMASFLSEKAAMDAGIHSSQLRAISERQG
jgi:hypothetical protein